MTLTYSSYIYYFKSILPTVCCVSKATGRSWARARALSLLLAALIIIIIIIIIFSKLNRIFEGLNMLEKSRNFAHAPEVAKIYIWYGFQKWVWQNGSTAPPIHFQRCAPRATFHVHVWKSVHSCNTPIPTKKSLEAKSQTQSWLFLINSSNFVSFLVFRSHTLTNSS